MNNSYEESVVDRRLEKLWNASKLCHEFQFAGSQEGFYVYSNDHKVWDVIMHGAWTQTLISMPERNETCGDAPYVSVCRVGGKRKLSKAREIYLSCNKFWRQYGCAGQSRVPGQCKGSQTSSASFPTLQAKHCYACSKGDLLFLQHTRLINSQAPDISLMCAHVGCRSGL